LFYSYSLWLIIGNEISIDAAGIFGGPTWPARALEIPLKHDQKEWRTKLAILLKGLVAEARTNFEGKLTYAAGTWEWMMPWQDLNLDILGINNYLGAHGEKQDPAVMDEKYLDYLSLYTKYGKK
jgi:hypothetical protein